MWKDFFLEILDLDRVYTRWEEVCGSGGVRESGKGGGTSMGRAGGNEMGAEVTRLGAAGVGDEVGRDGPGFGEMGMFGLGEV